MLRWMLVLVVVAATAPLCYAEPPKWLDENTLGFTVVSRDASDEDLLSYEKAMLLNAPKGAGVFVDRVFAHGQADGKLWPLAIITQANGKPMKTSADWKNLIVALKPGDKVKINFKPTLGNEIKSAWGKPETLSLTVSTKRDMARKAVTIKTDEVSGSKTAWFKDESKIATGDGPMRMWFSVGADGKATQPMLVITHIGKDWIFMDSVSVRAGDTLKTISLKDVIVAPSRKAVDGGVIEVCTVPMSGVVGDAAELMASKGKTIVRLSGTKPSVDHTITHEQKLAMWGMVAAFEAFDGEWSE